jgi:acyl dehydratase
MQMGTIDLQKLRGVGEKVFGLGKEFVGVVINNDRLQTEGDAQQDRASERLRALRKETEAQAKEAKAEVLERKERAAQRAKD